MFIGIADLFGRIGEAGSLTFARCRPQALYPQIQPRCLRSGYHTIAILPRLRNVHILHSSAWRSYQAQPVVILAEIFGKERTPPGLGLTTLAMGLAILPFPPLLGLYTYRSI